MLKQNGLYVAHDMKDEVIDLYKFTNCYRACDRVSQYLIKNIICDNSVSCEDQFIRVLLFKIFNKISTWEMLVDKIGDISSKKFSLDIYAKVFKSMVKEGHSIYSAAYIMPSGKKEFGSGIKYENNLRLVERMLRDEFHKRVWDFKSLEDIYKSFLSYPTIGPFLAYQYSIDIAYSGYTEADESSFVIAGPGAKRGIRKAFRNLGGYSDSDVIKIICDKQEFEFDRLGLKFRWLKGRKLQLIDCQNLFCEFDKYTRVKFPEYNLGRKRIKQKYHPSSEKIDFTFPDKWNAYLADA